MKSLQLKQDEELITKMSYPSKSIILTLICFILFSSQFVIYSQNYIPPYYSDTLLSQPVPFAPGLVLGSAPAFTPDGRTVYTHLYKENTGHTILVSHFINDNWTHSEVAEFSGRYDELEPCVSIDGSKLFFFSFRPYNGRNIGGQIWCMEKNDTGWNEPKLVESPIFLQNFYSGVPSISKNGTLYFGSTRRNGGLWPWEVYYSKFVNGKYGQPVFINDTINYNYLSWSHCVAFDESFLIFASERPDGFGDIDLYISIKENDKWTPAKNLGSIINTSKAEVWPRLSPDGKYLFFNRQDDGKEYIYQIDIEPLIDSLKNVSTRIIKTELRNNEFILEQNYPNPFNPETGICYRLSVNSYVDLKVYDMLGREVTTLVNEEQPAGSYEIKFSAGSIGGAGNLASGIYLYRIKAGDFVQTKKMILIR